MANAVIQAVVINNKGRVRTNNEDSYFLNGQYMPRERMNDGGMTGTLCEEYYQLYAVCDGMGGIDAGEEASYAVVNELADYQGRPGAIYSEGELTQVLRRISDKVYADSEANDRNSGTTLVMMAVQGNRVTLANVGDSRIYRMRGGQLAQMSTDHSEVQRMVKMGMISPEEARTHPRRHVITQFMGMPSDIPISPEIYPEIELRKDDIYLLCSDGLSDMLDDPIIEHIMRTSRDINACAEALVSAALQSGGRDNVTVLLVRVREILSGSVPGAPARRKRKGRKINLLLLLSKILVGGALLATAIDMIIYKLF